MSGRFASAMAGLAGLSLVALLAGACQTGPEQPIVYTAPPEVFARTFPPRSASPSTGASTSASAAAPSDSGVGSAAPSGSQAVGAAVRGQIIFGTAAGPDICTVLNPATVLASSQPFFFAAWLKDHMDGQQAIVLHVTRDGAAIVDHTEPADGTAFDCYGNQQPIGTLPPGRYIFQVLHAGTVEAQGSVTVQ